ncbi:C-type lectin domain family 2 member D3-like isoform X2 [Apodemus sylvaticus]|uniref:C-type lectin domain family 2 member D3-like isoform X2 n=1 Tax=Apodemus sylvaticus TaxID=10129 RepID=UPI002243C85B|nr:C-type lectin domain family 2 member D3-like isoform X2 [Apodemus sylvaticus]
MLTDTSLRLSQTSHVRRHHRLTFDAKKVLTLWTLLGGAVAVLLWGFFSFPKKFSVTRLSRNKTCDDEVKMCHGGWNKAGRNCFSFNQHKNSWITSKDYCKIYDATLAVFNNKAELEILMKQIHETQTYWIGLHRRNLFGIWVWTNGSMTSKIMVSVPSCIKMV